MSAVGVIFDDTRLAETTWENCDFDGATVLRSSSVWDTTFRSSDLRGVDFEGLQIVNTSFIDTDLTNSRFIGVRCQDCRFDNANLESTTFRRVGGSFTFTETTSLRFATFERDGVCGSSLRNTSLRNIDLTAADLTGICDLQSVDLENANLQGASVCRQNLHLLANTRGEVRPVECPEIPDCPGHTARCPEP